MTAQVIGWCMLVLLFIAMYLDCASRWGYLDALWMFIKAFAGVGLIFTALLLITGKIP